MSNTSKFPTHYEIALWWGMHHPERQFVCDIGEPSCFACGWFRKNEKQYRSLKEVWMHSGLERAHVVPNCVAENYSFDNFVLLCPKCHADAPMCHISTILPDWCERHEKCVGGQLCSDWCRELKAADITAEQFFNVRSQVMKIVLENFSGWHYGVGIPISTYTMIACEIIHGGILVDAL